MRINLEADEEIELVIDGACEFIVVGERNEEGTMIISWNRKMEDYDNLSGGEHEWSNTHWDLQILYE